jgi:hypothetical protein
MSLPICPAPREGFGLDALGIHRIKRPQSLGQKSAASLPYRRLKRSSFREQNNVHEFSSRHRASVRYLDADIRHGMRYRGIPLFASLWTMSVKPP